METLVDSLLEEFNRFFEGSAEAVIIGDTLQITIGSQILHVSMPKVIGAESKGSS